MLVEVLKSSFESEKGEIHNSPEEVLSWIEELIHIAQDDYSIQDGIVHINLFSILEDNSPHQELLLDFTHRGELHISYYHQDSNIPNAISLMDCYFDRDTEVFLYEKYLKLCVDKIFQIS